MKLEFGDLTLSGFRSFRDEQIFELGQLRSGLYFLRGDNLKEPRLESNGAGKSSLCEAFVWCGYGTTSAGLKNPDIKPWQHKRGMQTLVQLKGKLDGDHFAMTRQHDPNSFGVVGIGDYTDDTAASLFRMNVDLFTNTIVMGQGRPLFFDMPPRDKMQLFVDCLELDRWDNRSTAAAMRVAEVDREAGNAAADIARLEVNLTQMSEWLKSATTKADEWEAVRARRLDDTEAELKVVRKDFTKVKQLSNEADLANESASLDLKSMQQDIDKMVNRLSAKDQIIAEKTAQKEAKSAEIARLARDIDAFGNGTDCPICNQPVKGTVVDKHIREVKAKIKAIRDNIIDRADDLKKLQEAADALDKQIKATRQTLRDKQIKADEAQAKKELHAPRAAELSLKITMLEATLTAGEREANPHQDEVSKLRRETTKLKADIKQAQIDLDALRRAVERNRFWIKGFKDIRLLAIEDVLGELELMTNSSLTEMGLVDWSVRYAIERETKSGKMSRGLNVLIQSPSNAVPVKWECWSGGEGQRLRLCGALALSDVLLNHAGIQPDFEILDEPTKSLSAEGVEDLIDFLADRSKQLQRRTLYVDHMAIESTRFRDVITIVKDANGSRIEL